MKAKIILLLTIMIFVSARQKIFADWCGSDTSCTGACGGEYCATSGICSSGFSPTGTTCATASDPSGIYCARDGISICKNGSFDHCQCDPITSIPEFDAQCVANTIPTKLIPNEDRTATVEVKNVGSKTWTRTDNIRLGTQSWQDNKIWLSPGGVFNRVLLGSGDSIATDSTKIFSFTMHAPSTKGTYDGSSIARSTANFKMVYDDPLNGTWFGETCGPASVRVADLPSCGTVEAVLLDSAGNSTATLVDTNPSATRFSAVVEKLPDNARIRVLVKGLTSDTTVSRVAFATWNSVNGQDDLANPWPSVNVTGGAKETFYDIPLSKHNVADGILYSDVYLEDGDWILPQDINHDFGRDCVAGDPIECGLGCGRVSITIRQPEPPAGEIVLFGSPTLPGSRETSLTVSETLNLVVKSSAYAGYGLNTLDVYKRPCNDLTSFCTNSLGWVLHGSVSCLGTSCTTNQAWTPNMDDYRNGSSWQFGMKSVKNPSPSIAQTCWGADPTPPRAIWSSDVRRCDFEGNKIDDLMKVNLSPLYKISGTVNVLPSDAVNCSPTKGFQNASTFDPNGNVSVSIDGIALSLSDLVSSGGVNPSAIYETGTVVKGGKTLTSICVNNLNAPSGVVYELECLNGAKVTPTGNCVNINQIVNADQVVNISLREFNAPAWISSLRGDIFAGGGFKNYVIPTSVLGSFDPGFLNANLSPSGAFAKGGFIFSNTGTFSPVRQNGSNLNLVQSVGARFVNANSTNIWNSGYLASLPVPSDAVTLTGFSGLDTTKTYKITRESLNTFLESPTTVLNYSTNSKGVVVIYVTGAGTVFVNRAVQPTSLANDGRLLFVSDANFNFSPTIGVAGALNTTDLNSTVLDFYRFGLVTTGTTTLNGAGFDTDPSIMIEGPVLSKSNISINNRSRGPKFNSYPGVVFNNSTPYYLYWLNRLERNSGGNNPSGLSVYNVTWYSQ